MIDNPDPVAFAFVVRFDDPIPGAEEWDNEVQWFAEDHHADDLEVVTE